MEIWDGTGNPSDFTYDQLVQFRPRNNKFKIDLLKRFLTDVLDELPRAKRKSDWVDAFEAYVESKKPRTQKDSSPPPTLKSVKRRTSQSDAKQPAAEPSEQEESDHFHGGKKARKEKKISKKRRVSQKKAPTPVADEEHPEPSVNRKQWSVPVVQGEGPEVPSPVAAEQTSRRRSISQLQLGAFQFDYRPGSKYKPGHTPAKPSPTSELQQTPFSQVSVPSVFGTPSSQDEPGPAPAVTNEEVSPRPTRSSVLWSGPAIVLVLAIAMTIGMVAVIWNQMPVTHSGLDAEDVRMISQIRAYLQDQCGKDLCGPRNLTVCRLITVSELRGEVLEEYDISSDTHKRIEKVFAELEENGSRHFIEAQKTGGELLLRVRSKYANRPLDCVLRQFFAAHFMEVIIGVSVLLAAVSGWFWLNNQRKMQKDAQQLAEKVQEYLREHKRRHGDNEEQRPYIRVDQVRDAFVADNRKLRRLWPLAEAIVNETSLVDKTLAADSGAMNVPVWEWAGPSQLPVNRRLEFDTT